MIATWTAKIVTTRWRYLALSAIGIVAATALIGVIGAFGISSGATMTARALTVVPVDWQIALVPGADAQALTARLGLSASIRAARTVGYADASGFSAVTGGATQTTGAGQIVGLPGDYAATFPGQMRSLLGRTDGVLLAQQTAANLHATVGDVVTLTPSGAEPFDVTIEGIVDLLNADPMFQVIGPQKGLAATAPPDNVALVPMDVWTRHFASSTQRPGGGARLQIHAALDRALLPSAPGAAFIDVTGKAKNFEVGAAGEAMIGDNLATRLDAVRADALFARLLLLFLGLPCIVLALLLTISVARSDAARRRREHALLGLRGARFGQIAALTIVEAGLVAGAASLCGTALAAALARSILHIDPASTGVLGWLLGAGAAAFAVALLSIVSPALADLRHSTVAARRARLAPATPALWQRVFLDFGLIAAGALVYWRSASTGYQIVLAPEGVSAIAVDYTAFLAPLLFWTGSGLLVLRIVAALLRRQRLTIEAAMSLGGGGLASPVAAALSRQSPRLAAGAALVALAVAFATATAVFNATYNAQLLVDARLTNGADVAVTGTAASPAGDALDRIRRMPGVAAAEPMQHRFAYVGRDLQDIYGVDPLRIGQATDIVDAYFAGGARSALQKLAATPDGVFVSQETASDFQLSAGDVLNLRLQGAAGGPTKTVLFHFVGVVKEFPTAPRDSFLVANAAYLATQTDKGGAEIVLVRAKGDPATVAQSLRRDLGASSPLKTTDISQTAHLIGSNLTAVDLSVLGWIELGFAILFVALATGLTLWLGQPERTRANAILLSLGASRAGIRSFLWGEAAISLGFGLPFGAAIGAVTAWMLVRLLNGAFDPAPDVLTWPWAFLGLIVAGAVGATSLAVFSQSLWTKEWAVRELRAGG